MAETHYVINARPPVRAFVIAAVLSLVGAALLVFALLQAAGWLLAALGVLLLLLGVGLLLAGFAAMGAQRMTLTLSEDGYLLSGRGGSESGTWAAVTRVTQSADGSHLTIFEGPDVRRHLLFAPGATTRIDELLADITRRLDHAKGYRDF